MSRGGNLVQPPDNFNDPELDERERIIAALEHAGWVQAKAARLLGMTPRQVGLSDSAAGYPGAQDLTWAGSRGAMTKQSRMQSQSGGHRD